MLILQHQNFKDFAPIWIKYYIVCMQATFESHLEQNLKFSFSLDMSSTLFSNIIGKVCVTHNCSHKLDVLCNQLLYVLHKLLNFSIIIPASYWIT